MLTLAISIILLMILSLTINVNVKSYGEEKRKSYFEADLKNIKEALDQYYARYEKLPVLIDNNGNEVEYDRSYENFNKILDDKDWNYLNINDKTSGINANIILAPYYVIDKDMLDVSINYSDKTFIVNSQSHTIYIPEGIVFETDVEEDEEVEIHYSLKEVYTDVDTN